jgi:LPLT family lysophospholipid transporter-like MFS transporter
LRFSKRHGFGLVVLAQFFSSLADSALLIAAIALLAELQYASWTTPLLKVGFNGSYVLLAVAAGFVADAHPKGRVMLASNLVKIAGCLLLFSAVHPLLGYALVGVGAAFFSPAKFGILSEILPAHRLVGANGWMEGSTVLSIIGGTVLGGLLISPRTSSLMLGVELPSLELSSLPRAVDTPAEAAIFLVGVLYATAALLCLLIPATGTISTIGTSGAARPDAGLARRFRTQCRCLWRDPQGRISLAVTTLFWGAGATLQFIVLKWAESALGLPLGKAAILQGMVAIGVACGAITAGQLVTLRQSFRVLPAGIGLGLIVLLMTVVTQLWLAIPLLFVVGALGGYFVVPMNAILQYRGQTLMSAGQSIAVQNFSENIAVLGMLGLYSLLVWLNVPMNAVIILFGAMLSGVMLLLLREQRRYPRHAMIPG